MKTAISENRRAVRDATGLTILENLIDIYGRQVERADGEDDWEALEETVLVDIQRREDGTPVGASLNEEKLEAWLSFPSETYLHFVSEMLDEVGLENLASMAATHTAFWANEELNRRLEEEGTDPESLSHDRLNRRLAEEFESRDYVERVMRGVRGEAAVQAIEAFHHPDSDGWVLTPSEIEGLLGLDDENDTPTPRRETPEWKRSPFQAGQGRAAGMVSGPFILRSTRALSTAKEQPAPSGEGDWIQGPTGRPVYVDTFGGNPYDGTVTFTVRAAGEATAADMDASLAWAMLDEIGPQLYGGTCIFSHTPPTRRAAVPESGWGRSTPSILSTPWDCAGRRKTLPSSDTGKSRVS